MSRVAKQRNAELARAAANQQKQIPADYRNQDAETLITDAERESLRRLMWQMEHGPTLIAKERAAALVAKLTLRRPPQRIQHEGPGGGPVKSEHTLVFVDVPKPEV